MDNLDKQIKKIVSQEIDIPNSYKNMIRNALRYKTNLKNKRRYSFFKVASMVCVSLLVLTGATFACEYIVTNFFNFNKGIDVAIKNEYILNNNDEYVLSNNVGIKINKLLMDDFNLNMLFSVSLGEEVESKEFNKIEFLDMIIYDNDKNILYCENKKVFEDFCKANKLNYKWKENNSNYINSGSNYYIKSQDKNNIDIIYNLFSEKYPRSKKIIISLNKIKLTGSKNMLLEGDWDIEINIPEKFYNREAIIYKVEKCDKNDLEIQEVIVYDTGTKVRIQTEEKPDLPYNENDDEKTKEIKLREAMEQEKNVTLEEFLSRRKFKNEYIENERGERFYPSNSNSEDSGYSNTEMKYLNYWQTFTMTRYDATDKLKLYINYKGEDVLIQLKRK